MSIPLEDNGQIQTKEAIYQTITERFPYEKNNQKEEVTTNIKRERNNRKPVQENLEMVRQMENHYENATKVVNNERKAVKLWNVNVRGTQRI